MSPCWSIWCCWFRNSTQGRCPAGPVLSTQHHITALGRTGLQATLCHKSCNFSIPPRHCSRPESLSCSINHVLIASNKQALTKQKPIRKLPLIFNDLPWIIKHHYILDEKNCNSGWTMLSILCPLSFFFLSSRYHFLSPLSWKQSSLLFVYF